jgi:uncharacterized protein (DUF1015 family)
MQAPRICPHRPASTTVRAIAAAPGSRDPEELVPEIRPFRALRYDPEVAGDPAALVALPYDVIGPELHRELLARHPRNAVRLDLPQVVPGEDPDERYRRVARTLAAWRQDGTLRKDPKPSVYVYEQAYRVPGTTIDRTQRGFFARLLIEPFGPGSGVLPHERTLSGPKEDRYRLLRAAGINTSPVVALYEDPGRTAAAALRTVTAGTPVLDVVDDDRVRHRLWAVPDEGEAGVAARLCSVAGAGPVFIADGHHRYETAVRYRDERRSNHTGEQDPSYDFVLMLLLDAADDLTVLPTHRVVRGLGESGLERLLDGLPRLFTVTPAMPEMLVERFGAAGGLAGGEGRFGLLTREGAWLLDANRAAFAGLGSGGDAVMALDVSLLGTALDRLLGIDATAVADGRRIAYVKSAGEAAASVAAGTDGADAAFLLEPTPVASILAVARDGDVMPQKSTYFYPKALTGLVLNPHEW